MVGEIDETTNQQAIRQPAASPSSIVPQQDEEIGSANDAYGSMHEISPSVFRLRSELGLYIFLAVVGLIAGLALGQKSLVIVSSVLLGFQSMLLVAFEIYFACWARRSLS